ncbi:MAG: 3-phosphoshikimate 1-carboxyvinyltransferase [Verrucomicrobiota bacterium]|nr:3-phosphoshikimate 1-carboxyvinyltransferase [Verrucomicrobiota bacterium]
MSDPLPIVPFTESIDSEIDLPGSKSITNRALILAALTNGQTLIKGALLSRDTQIMLQALELLGFNCIVDPLKLKIIVHGMNGRIPKKKATLDVGNAGTAARFLTALLAIEPGGTYSLDGDLAMRSRPMAGLLNALSELGAADFEFVGEPGHFPFIMKTHGFNGGTAKVDASTSSQILSALLLASGANARAPIKLRTKGVRPAYIAITLNMREAFGAPPVLTKAAGLYEIPPAIYRAPDGGHYTIEPDLSAASYFLALTLITGGKLSFPRLTANPLQGDALFSQVLTHHGLHIDCSSDGWIATNKDTAAIERGHREIDFRHFSDTFLTYAAIAPLLGGSVRITGIEHTRGQETDRIAGMANELSKLGQLVKEDSDSLTIAQKPNELKARALQARQQGKLIEIETYKDHRFAMSFAILGSYDLLHDGQPWLAVKDPACCGKTFPNFFEVLKSLRHE